MNEQDFKQLFGLSCVDVGEERRESARAALPASDYCLRLDEWDKRRGEFIAQLPYAQEALGELERDAEWLFRASSDFHALAFEYDPQLEDAPCHDGLRKEFIGNLRESPEYPALRASTRGNLIASDLACLSLLRSFAESSLKQSRRDKDNGTSAIACGEGADAVDRRIDALQAAMQAAEDVAECGNALTAMGCGAGAGQSDVDRQRVAETFQQIKDSPLFRAVLNAAGALRRKFHSLRKRKVVLGVNDVVGVRSSSSVQFMLPSETAYLSHQWLQYEFARKLGNSEIRRFDCRDTHKVGKGPIIVFCDASGSMSQVQLAQARGLAMAILWLAKAQKRPCLLINFDTTLFDARVSHLSEQADVYRWITQSGGGGTSFSFLNSETITKLCLSLKSEVGKTDLILISDGICGVPHIAEFTNWKRSVGMKLHTLLIGCGATDEIRAASDETREFADLSASSGDVDGVLTI